VVVTPIADALAEGVETVVLTLVAGAGYAVGAPASAQVDVADTAVSAGTLDSFICYAVKPTKGNVCAATAGQNAGGACVVETDCGGLAGVTADCRPNKLPKGVRAALLDDFESATHDFKKVVTLCKPASRAGGAIDDPATHLEGFAIALAKLPLAQPKHQKRLGVSARTAVNPNGVLLDTTKPDRLLVPSSASEVAPIGPPNRTQHGVDHFKCYAVKVGSGSGAFPKGLSVRLADAFGQEKLFALKKPTRLCLAADKDLQGVDDPDANLLCYAAKPVKKSCAPGSPFAGGGACKKEEDCGGTSKVTGFCQTQPKHLKRAGLFVGNDVALGRVGTSKEVEVCLPAGRP
jgi:hypothetical protein